MVLLLGRELRNHRVERRPGLLHPVLRGELQPRDGFLLVALVWTVPVLAQGCALCRAQLELIHRLVQVSFNQRPSLVRTTQEELSVHVAAF